MFVYTSFNNGRRKSPSIYFELVTDNDLNFGRGQCVWPEVWFLLLSQLSGSKEILRELFEGDTNHVELFPQHFQIFHSNAAVASRMAIIFPHSRRRPSLRLKSMENKNELSPLDSCSQGESAHLVTKLLIASVKNQQSRGIEHKPHGIINHHFLNYQLFYIFHIDLTCHNIGKES